MTDVAGVLLWKQNALHISLFCCQLSFVDDIFKCLQFGSFSCGFIRNSRFSLLNSIQFLLVHFEKKTQFIFVSIWLYRDFFWVPTQPTLVWSWADAHATDTIDIERGDYNFRYAAWNSGHVTSLRCFGKLAWHGVMKTSLAEGSNAWDKPPW